MLDAERVVRVAHGPGSGIWRHAGSEMPLLDVALSHVCRCVRPVPPIHQDVIEGLLSSSCYNIDDHHGDKIAKIAIAPGAFILLLQHQ